MSGAGAKGRAILPPGADEPTAPAVGLWAAVGRGLRWVGLASGLLGCRGDATTPALHTEAPPPAAAAEPEPEPATPSGSATERELWFADGPGRVAIIARERRDHAAARRALDAVLADESIDTDTRGGAQVLRGLEHLLEDEHAQAAELFAAARSAEGIAPIELHLRLWEAQARLDAGQPEPARAALSPVDPADWAASAVGGDAQLVDADARLRTGDRAGAEAGYRAYLDRYPRGGRRFEARIKLARSLAEHDQRAARREALELYDKVRQGVPLSDYAAEAERELARLERELGPLRSGSEARAFAREQSLAQAEALLDRRRYAQAVKAVDAVVSKGGLDASQRCRAYYVKGSSIFKQRRRADARSSFDRAASECAKAGRGQQTRRVKSRYQGARGWYAAGKYARAAEAFEALAADHPDHSYADDALVLAGESWESHGEPERAARAYRAAIDEHPGDMRHEARRRLLVMRFAAGDDAAALDIIDAALETEIRRPVERAKLHYFRGRALDRLGRTDEADAAWLAALDHAPLAYPGVQALSRLRERGPQGLESGLERLRGAPEAAASSAPRPTTAPARRARIFARLGLGDQARAELEHAGVEGWPAVVLLNQAGLYPKAQLELANLGTTWRSTPPGADNRWRWEGAHPRPFFEIIGPGESEHGVPAWLTYAIMQTESRFDPGVTSFAGARGLVQLMPATARGLAARAGVRLERDGESALFEPALNLDLGMRYLARLTARYGEGDAAAALAIPSYNAGEGSVDRWLRERGSWELDMFLESIPYDETRRYVQSVLGRWAAYRWLYGEGEDPQRVPYLPLATPAKAKQ